jgi:ABC-type branched-subunit amino acid transport system ATPase component
MRIQVESQTNHPILEVDQVTKDFGGLRAVNRVSLTMEKGKVYGLVGPNGAGKTTLFNVLTGFLKPDSGEIYYKSRRITKTAAHQVVQLGMARTFQHVRVFPNLTALDHIMMGYQNQVGETAPGGIFKWWGASEKANREKAMTFLDTFGLKARALDPAEDLSYPEQKIIILARAVATGADFLLVDEPTSGLDQRSFKGILAFLRNLVDEQGKTVCVVEHNLDLIREICDWMFFLHHGELIAAGTCAELLKRQDLAEIYFGKEGELV